jgi:hypothetical protein
MLHARCRIREDRGRHRIDKIVQHYHDLDCIENEEHSQQLGLMIEDANGADAAEDVAGNGEVKEVVQRRRQRQAEESTLTVIVCRHVHICNRMCESPLHALHSIQCAVMCSAFGEDANTLLAAPSLLCTRGCHRHWSYADMRDKGI